MHKKLAAGLEKIVNEINPSSGLSHPNDLGKTVELLGMLIDAGYHTDDPDEVYEHLTDTLKLGENTAMEIVRVYRTLKLRRNDPDGPWWPQDTVDKL